VLCGTIEREGLLIGIQGPFYVVSYYLSVRPQEFSLHLSIMHLNPKCLTAAKDWEEIYFLRLSIFMYSQEQQF